MPPKESESGVNLKLTRIDVSEITEGIYYVYDAMTTEEYPVKVCFHDGQLIGHAMKVIGSVDMRLDDDHPSLRWFSIEGLSPAVKEELTLV